MSPARFFQFGIALAASAFASTSGAQTRAPVETVVAVRNGSSATCSFPIRFSWNLSSGSSMVNTTYLVTALPANLPSTGGALVQRIAAGGLPSVTMIPNATSLWRTVAVTL